MYTTNRGSQTDPATFYVNGKPARAVAPFRVTPIKPKPPPVDTVPQVVEASTPEEQEEFLRPLTRQAARQRERERQRRLAAEQPVQVQNSTPNEIQMEEPARGQPQSNQVAPGAAQGQSQARDDIQRQELVGALQVLNRE